MPEDDARAASAPEFSYSVHAAAELLRAIATDNTDDLDQWRTIYGTLQAGFPKDVVEPVARRAGESFRKAARSGTDLGQAVGALVADVVGVLSETSNRVLTTTVAAHVALEKKLLEDLAAATGRTPAEVLTELDTWVSEQDPDQ
ncbi:hypothetical protein [Amycolatopsis sp. WGS_07]|uniref:hypothetical protein n=1 Tax=Amycolatopsis sp. WGS_07 TaxID=3076764 RepID=UPI003872F1EC